MNGYTFDFNSQIVWRNDSMDHNKQNRRWKYVHCTQVVAYATAAQCHVEKVYSDQGTVSFSSELTSNSTSLAKWAHFWQSVPQPTEFWVKVSSPLSEMGDTNNWETSVMSWGFTVMWLLRLTLTLLEHHLGLLEFFHGYHWVTPFHGIPLSGLLVRFLTWSTSRGIAAVSAAAFSSDETEKKMTFFGVFIGAIYVH